jgi:hypothetical protein
MEEYMALFGLLAGGAIGGAIGLFNTVKIHHIFSVPISIEEWSGYVRQHLRR